MVDGVAPRRVEAPAGDDDGLFLRRSGCDRREGDEGRRIAHARTPSAEAGAAARANVSRESGPDAKRAAPGPADQMRKPRPATIWVLVRAKPGRHAEHGEIADVLVTHLDAAEDDAARELGAAAERKPPLVSPSETVPLLSVYSDVMREFT